MLSSDAATRASQRADKCCQPLMPDRDTDSRASCNPTSQGIQLTIKELVNEHKVVLDRFLIEFAKIAPSDIDHAVAELEDERCVRVASVRKTSESQ